jgi:PPM family protein phosphatase
LTTLRSGSASDVGRVRSVNEDLVLDASPLYGVADGMGGHVGGDVAARTAVDALRGAFEQRPTAEGLLAAVQEANTAVWERGRADADLRGMGTTLTVAALATVPGGDEERLILVNVGDSRAYLYRDGALQQLTTDHSVAEELVARGELTPDEAASVPQRHILTRALGVAPVVEVDAWELSPEAGDRYLLCSDGLSNEVDQDVMTEVLASEPDPAKAAKELVAVANDNGGSDNITVVVLDVVSVEQPGRQPDVDMVASNGDGSSPRGAPVPLTRSAMVAGSSAQGGTIGALATMDAPPVGPESSERTDSDTGTEAAFEPGLGGLEAESKKSLRARIWPRRRTAEDQKSPRLVTVRLVAFLALVAAVVVGAWGLLRWYQGSNYFLTVDGSNIVVEQGHPGGFLWFDPKVVDQTGVTTSEVPANQLSEIRVGSFSESTAAGARAQLRRLVLTQCSYQQEPGATTTTTTTKSLPAIARCPSEPTSTVTPPPTTATTASPRSTGKSTGSTTSTTAKGAAG